MNILLTVLEVLQYEDLTIKQISKITSIKENSIRTIINRNKHKGIIKETKQFRNKYKIYTVLDKEYINDINSYIELVRKNQKDIREKLYNIDIKADMLIKAKREFLNLKYRKRLK
jgi:transposase